MFIMFDEISGTHIFTHQKIGLWIKLLTLKFGTGHFVLSPALVIVVHTGNLTVCDGTWPFLN